MLYAYFDPNSRAVLGWFDTSAYEINLPDTSLLIELTQKQWDSYNGKTCWVNYKGALVQTQPRLEVSLVDAKAAKLLEVDAACAEEIGKGFTSDALGDVHTYPAKATDQTNLMASVLVSMLPVTPEDWTTPFWCADASGNWGYKLHTAAQIQTVGIAGHASIALAIGKKVVLEQKIAAALSNAEVAVISWTMDLSSTATTSTTSTTSTTTTESAA